jgi:hypothetical protein
MAALNNPKLTVEVNSNTSLAICTASVDVALSDFELALITLLHPEVHLGAKVVGIDPVFDDDLFTFDSQPVTNVGTFIFQKTVSRSTINEDSPDNDELIARFSLVSADFAQLNKNVDSPELDGDFS